MDEIKQQLKELQLKNQQLEKRLTESASGSQQPQADLSVNRVSVKLPPFWADKPAVWFAQADAQFSVSGITQESSRFSYVVAQLDSRHAAEVEDIITAPPADNPYTYLRKEFIRRFSMSEEQRVRQLLMEEELGERKPSQFLRHLRSLAGSTQVQDSLLRTLWLQRLPNQVHAILQTQAELSLDKLAELADRIVEVSPIQTPVAIHAVAPSAASELAVLTKRIDDVTREVAALRSRSHSRMRQPRTRSRRRESTDRQDICWYHRRFRSKAKKCTTPCNYSTNSNSNQK